MFNTTPEYVLVEQEYTRYKNDMLMRSSEDIYNNALTIFVIEQAFYTLSEYMEHTECVSKAVAACDANGKGFLAQLAEWVSDLGGFDFSDTENTIIMIYGFVQALSDGEWELDIDTPTEAPADKFPAKVLESHIVVPCADYPKAVGALRGFTVTKIIDGPAYTMVKVAIADIANTSINALDAEIRAAAPYITNGFVRVLGLLGPWYWIFRDGKVEVEYHGACPLPQA